MKLRNKIASVMSENCHFEEELKNTKQEILDTGSFCIFLKILSIFVFLISYCNNILNILQ